MTTNKTPIQELIDYCVNNKQHHHCDSIHHQIEYLDYKDIIGKLSRVLQKEKAFAFDCFEAGKDYGFDVCMAIDWGDNPTKQDFDQFYAKYAEQHH